MMLPLLYILHPTLSTPQIDGWMAKPGNISPEPEIYPELTSPADQPSSRRRQERTSSQQSTYHPFIHTVCRKTSRGSPFAQNPGLQMCYPLSLSRTSTYNQILESSACPRQPRLSTHFHNNKTGHPFIPLLSRLVIGSLPSETSIWMSPAVAVIALVNVILIITTRPEPPFTPPFTPASIPLPTQPTQSQTMGSHDGALAFLLLLNLAP